MEQQSNFVPNLTLGYGAFLIAWGIVVSILSDSTSFTSYIPSMLGAPLALAGVMVMRMPEKRKLWMHIAATFGLLCAIGGTRFFMVMGNGNPYASGSMLMLLVTGSAYTAVCVRSFIAARKAREAAEASA
jgi:peptidoglycan/LPS O-acetylase OafA/YrhL